MRTWLARVAAAAVAALAAWLGVELLNSTDATTDKTGQLQEQLTEHPPASADQVAKLSKQVGNLPSELPTPRVVVTAVPGPPGANGRDGTAGVRGPAGTPGRTTVVTVAPRPAGRPPAATQPRPARPAPTVTVTARPTCIAYVAGLCVSR